MKVGTALFAIAAASSVAVAMPLQGPEPEVKHVDVKVKLPAVPDFAMPPTPVDAADPKALRVDGRPLLGKDIAVTGYVVWIYNCLSAIRKPGESKAAAQQRIDDDQTICERAKLYLGSSPKTPPEKALWVVDVPRPPYKLERERLPKEKLDAWPAVPKLKVGDHVTVKGRFDVASPHQERNSDGLLIFASVAPAHSAPGTGKPVAMPLHATPAPAIPTAPPEKPVDPTVRKTSIIMLNTANKLLGEKQPKEALAMYEGALHAWPDNTLALYGDGLANIELRNYAASVTPLDHAVEVAPDQPMYQMWVGIAAYEAAVDGARVSQAVKAGKKPAEIDPDLSKLEFTKARNHLALAVAINPGLWRAHYYLGRIWRAEGAARDAAGEFSKAIETNPHESGPYIALSELYRKWDYTDQAITVAETGSRNVMGDNSDVFYVLGLAYDDKGNYKKAIDAYTLAVTAKSTNLKPLFQRGQAYFKLGDKTKAKEDLDAFLAGKSASLEFARQQAHKMLQDIAAKK